MQILYTMSGILYYLLLYMARLGDWSHPGQLKPPLGHLLIPTQKNIIEFGHMGDEKS